MYAGPRDGLQLIYITGNGNARSVSSSNLNHIDYWGPFKMVDDSNLDSAHFLSLVSRRI